MSKGKVEVITVVEGVLLLRPLLPLAPLLPLPLALFQTAITSFQ